jgi:hypothetical protein
MIGDKVVYCLNSAAVGDLIAAAPSVKYAIENFHKNSDYLVGIHEEFRVFFPFVPEDKFVEVKAEYDKEYAIRHLNMLGVGGKVCKLTPSRMNLTHYASVSLLARVLPEHQLQYVPLQKVDVSRYGLDFSKCVIIITTFRDKQRTIPAEEITKIAEFVQYKGLTPVYVGKTGAISIWKKNLAKTDFEYPGFGVDLRNDTTFLELASIMDQAKAVVGMDGGPIHLAFTTKVPVVCGFTTVAPEFRIPYRGSVKTEAVVPNIFCNFCESNWSLNYWDFSKCPRKLEAAECVTKMSSGKFINALSKLGIFNEKD